MSCEVRLTDPESAPNIILTDFSHELAQEQRDGIASTKVLHLVHRLHVLFAISLRSDRSLVSKWSFDGRNNVTCRRICGMMVTNQVGLELYGVTQYESSSHRR